VASDGINGAQWESAIETVREYFLEALSDGRLLANGKKPTAVVRVDAGKTEKTFGIRLTRFEG
jgi:hypothetical protein